MHKQHENVRIMTKLEEIRLKEKLQDEVLIYTDFIDYADINIRSHP